MKLITYQLGETQRIGVLIDPEKFIDLQAASKEILGEPQQYFDSMQALIESGSEGLDAARKCLDAAPDAAIGNLAAVKLLAPIPVPAQMRDFVAFEEHMKRSTKSAIRHRAILKGGGRFSQSMGLFMANLVGMGGVPKAWYTRPIYYKCNRFSITGHDETVVWPHYSKNMDYECELACVIGRKGRDIDRAEASDYIFGFMIFNDLSARDAQTTEMGAFMGPAKGKDFDNGCPMGPYLVTADEISDPYNLEMIVKINGQEVSRNSSSTMYWSFEDMIAETSAAETLHPGEIFGSGTVGHGCGFEDMKFLSNGDVIEMEISGLGVLRTTISADPR